MYKEFEEALNHLRGNLNAQTYLAFSEELDLLAHQIGAHNQDSHVGGLDGKRA